MKKILTVLLSVVFVLSLFAGCVKPMTDEEILQRAEELQAEKANKQEEISIETPEPSVSETREDFGEINFSIPSTWRKAEAEDGFYYYPYEDNTTLLYARYDSTESFPAYDITNIDEMTELFDSFIEGTKEGIDSYNLQSKEVKSFIDGTNYLIMNYTGKIGGIQYEFLTCFFCTSTQDYSIAFGQPSNISKSFREIYGRVLDSIQINHVSPTPTENAMPTSNETVSQSNAVRSAISYLKYTAFSRTGLIKQLEYEGFSNEDATYGVDNCGADWKEQALLSAQSYLKYSSFSRKGLIKQLEYEGFSNEDATYGVDNCGADWMEQAVLSAQNFLKYSSFSRKGLIKQLEYEGFTKEQAEYGVNATGL